MTGVDRSARSAICVYYIDNLARGGREQVHMEKLVLDS